MSFQRTKVPEYKKNKNIVLDCMNLTDHNSDIITEVKKCYDFYKSLKNREFLKYIKFW